MTLIYNTRKISVKTQKAHTHVEKWRTVAYLQIPKGSATNNAKEKKKKKKKMHKVGSKPILSRMYKCGNSCRNFDTKNYTNASISYVY
jgi:hypothetical protein